MVSILRSFLLLAGHSVLSCSVFGQTYTIATLAGGGLPLNMPGTSSSLGRIDSVATDASGNVFMTVPDYAIVVRWDAVTGIVTLVAGNGNGPGTPGGDNGPATSAQLNNPSGIAVDSGGSIYIADAARIRMVSNGVITTIAGNGIVGFAGDSGPASEAELGQPRDVAVDATGTVYFSDTFLNRIRALTPVSQQSPTRVHEF